MRTFRETKTKGVVLLATVLTLALSPVAGRAGDGVVALQTADAACADDSGNIYVDCGNGTVTDNRTGLVWLKDADCLLKGATDWFTTMDLVAGLKDISPDSALPVHDCGLSDGSSPGEWRLPSGDEWEAMIADAQGEEGDPDCTATPPLITNDSGGGCWVSGPSSFLDVQSAQYWSSTTSVVNPTGALFMNLSNGEFGSGLKESLLFFWPVRGGQ